MMMKRITLRVLKRAKEKEQASKNPCLLAGKQRLEESTRHKFSSIT
jgi:hypothetical protein